MITRYAPSPKSKCSIFHPPFGRGLLARRAITSSLARKACDVVVGTDGADSIVSRASSSVTVTTAHSSRGFLVIDVEKCLKSISLPKRRLFAVVPMGPSSKCLTSIFFRPATCICKASEKKTRADVVMCPPAVSTSKRLSVVPPTALTVVKLCHVQVGQFSSKRVGRRRISAVKLELRLS